MAQFSGQYQHMLDQKNRLFIPAKLREGLGEAFKVFIPGPEADCVVLYTCAEWDAFIAKVSENLTGNALTKYIRYLYCNMDEVVPDKQGRVTLRQSFCEFAGLEKEAAIIGVGHKVEIWNPKKLEGSLQDTAEDPDFNLSNIAY